MKVPILGALVALLCFSIVGAEQDFDAFVTKFNKTYRSILEKTMRREIFLKNRQLINRFNSEKAQQAGYCLGLNHLSDFTDDELAIMRGVRMPKDRSLLKNSPEAERYFRELMVNSGSIPDEVDWTKVDGRVSEVKDQGICGSCWAFSTTGALEGQMKSKLGKLISLSEQDLIDCSYTNHGCDGGFPFIALSDITRRGGIQDEASYPYVGASQNCSFKRNNSVFNDKGSYMLESGNEEALKAAVAIVGPVSVLIDAYASTFSHYKDGVYSDPECGTYSINHAVLVVGYGKDSASGKDYWLVKNSWGSDWGAQGYIKIARNANNLCFIASFPLIPIV